MGATLVGSRGLAKAIIPALLLFYTAPIFALSWASITGHLNGAATIGQWFLVLISSPDSLLGLYQKILLPVTAGVTVAALWSERSRKWSSLVVIGLLIAISLSIYLQILFGITDIQKNMYQPANNPLVTSIDQFHTLANSFLNRIQESLTTYLLILLGLEAIPQSGTTAPSLQRGAGTAPAPQGGAEVKI